MNRQDQVNENGNYLPDEINASPSSMQKSITDCFKKFRGTFRSICKKYLRREDDIDDVIQDAMEEVINRYDSIYNLPAYSCKMVVCKCREFIEKRSKLREAEHGFSKLQDFQMENEKEISISRKEAMYLLEQMLRALPNHKYKIMKAWANGYSYKDIAEDLGEAYTVDSVRGIIFRTKSSYAN